MAKKMTNGSVDNNNVVVDNLMTNGNQSKSKSNGINNHNHNDKSNGSMVIGKTFGRYLYER